MASRSTFGSIRQLGKSRHQARYTGPDGERYVAPHRFATKTDARNWLNTIYVSTSNGTWISPNAPKAQSYTFERRAEIWLGLRRKDHSPRYRDELLRMLQGPRLAKFRPLGLGEINREMVDEWWSDLPDTPTENARVYAFMNGVMIDALDRELIDRNPCRIKGGSSVKRKKIITILAHKKVRELAESIGGRYLAMVYVAANCCLRFGELTELRRKDLVDNKLQIRRAVTWVAPDQVPTDQKSKANLIGQDGKPLKKVAVVKEPKSVAGVRDVPVPPHVRAILAEHMLKYAEPGDDGLIFPRESGGHMAHGSLYKVFKRARRDIGRSDLAWHHLRHTGAVTYLKSGTKPHELMTILGHEKMNVTMLYLHVVDGDLVTAGERVSEFVLDDLLSEDLTIEVDEDLANEMAVD